MIICNVTTLAPGISNRAIFYEKYSGERRDKKK
jgi:hypothetical protein